MNISSQNVRQLIETCEDLYSADLPRNDMIAMLTRFAEILESVERGEFVTIRYAGRPKFDPCCDGTDYRCSICGGIVRYDGTPPEAE